MLGFDDLLIYWNVQVVQLHVLGKEKNSSWSTDACDAPSTGHGLSNRDTEEPCGVSPFLSFQVGGE